MTYKTKDLFRTFEHIFHEIQSKHQIHETRNPIKRTQQARVSSYAHGEHILNQTMVRMFGCPRSKNAHIERKKSKCDYLLAEEPSAEAMAEVEKKINEVIDRHLP